MGGSSTNGGGWNAPPPSYSSRSNVSGMKSTISPTSPITTTSSVQATPNNNENTTNEPVFSAMPSRIPDAGWASWGTDPSKIKKEEDQVKRPPPRSFAQTTLSSSGSAVTAINNNNNKASSIASISRNGAPVQSNTNGHPSSPTPLQQNNNHVRQQTAQAYTNGNGSGFGNGRNSNGNGSLPVSNGNGNSSSNNGWMPNAQSRNLQVRLPGHQQHQHFQQQQPQRRQYSRNVTSSNHNRHNHQQQSTAAVPVTSSLSMRPPQVPVTYTTRPTFQYGKVTTATPVPSPRSVPAVPMKAIISEVLPTSTAQKDVPPPLAPAEETTLEMATRNAQSHPIPATTHWKNIVQQSGINEVFNHIKNNGHNPPTSPTRSHKKKSSKSKSKTSRVGSATGAPAVSPTMAEGTIGHRGTTPVSAVPPALPATGTGWDSPTPAAAVSGQGWGSPVVEENLKQSTGADSGHASFESSAGTPSTLRLSSAPSVGGPKVSLPPATVSAPAAVEEGAQSSAVTPSPKSPLTTSKAPRAEASSPKSRTTQFKLHIPKNITLPAALKALDLDNLELVAGKKVEIGIDSARRLVTFEIVADHQGDQAARKKCAMLVGVAASALKELCEPEKYEVLDQDTRILLGLQKEDKAAEEPTTSNHDALPREEMVGADCASTATANMPQDPALDRQKSENTPKLVAPVEQHDYPTKNSASEAIISLPDDRGNEGVQSHVKHARTASELLKSLMESSVTAVSPQLSGNVTPKHDRPEQSLVSTSSQHIAENTGALPSPDGTEHVKPPAATHAHGGEGSASYASGDPESDNPRNHPFIKRSSRFPDLLELPLRMPDSIIHNIVKPCQLERHIPLNEVYYNRNYQILFLRHEKIANLELARSVLLVVMRLVAPNFRPNQAVFQLEEGSLGHRLAAELRAASNHPMRNAKMDDLTAYIVNRLGASSTSDGQVQSSPFDNVNSGTSDWSVAANNSTSQDSTLSTSIVAAGVTIPTMQETVASTDKLAVEYPPARMEVNDAGAQALMVPPYSQTLKEASPNYSEMNSEELQRHLTPENSICWFLPKSPGRRRFLGPSGCWLEAIRSASGVANVFWRTDFGHAEDWFIVIIGAYAPTLTSQQRQALAYAFRLCKSWAFAVRCEDLLPVTSELSESIRSDHDFRLNDFEVKTAFAMSFDLVTVTDEQVPKRYSAALSQLARCCSRREEVSSHIRLPASNRMRSACVEELCTVQNSICWTAHGQTAARQLMGERGSLSRIFGDIFAIAAIKIDLSEHRYGQDACRISILACDASECTKSEEKNLSRTFRTVAALMRLLEYDSLLPTQENLGPQSLGLPLLRLVMEDERRTRAIAANFGDGGLSDEKICMVASTLFPASLPNSPMKPPHHQQEFKLDYPEDRLVADEHASRSSNQDVAFPEQPTRNSEVRVQASTLLVLDNPPFGKRSNTASVQSNGEGEKTKAALIAASQQDDELYEKFAEYKSIRDIPGFSCEVGCIDDGYITIEDEPSLFEDFTSQWSALSHQRRLELIGSAFWATNCLRELVRGQKSMVQIDNESIGPSASQVGPITEDDAVSQDDVQASNKPHDTSGWQAAHDQVEAEDAVLPRVQNWAQQVAHDADSLQKLQSSSVQQTSYLAPCLAGETQLVELKQPGIFLAFPNDRTLRKSILGENNELLQKVALHTGAVVHLEPQLNYKPDNERLVWVGGKYECIARAMQMLSVAVKTHVPSWRFPFEQEVLIHNLNEAAEAAETERLLSGVQGRQTRWGVGHTVFIPETAITLVEAAIKDNAFSTDCATFKIDPVLIGNIRINAPTCNQSDAALIKLCDIVRRIDPAWMPSGEDARMVIEQADAHSGPGLKAIHPALPAENASEKAAQEELFRTAGSHWRSPSGTVNRQVPFHSRQVSQQTA